ncbi:P-loop NTPase fold protein [Sphaerisporangium sp. B11E5]|uniref:P-loop NTPase fold protein n=1 Tax=Sphaerisporangium sp. B11E5 TaxID=3153563 RepID=UPI00325D6D64
MAAFTVAGWTREHATALTERRALSPGAVLFDSFALLVGSVLASALFATLAAKLYRLSRSLRAGDEVARARRSWTTAFVAVLIMAIFVTAGATTSGALVWQYAHGRPLGANTPYGWGAVVGLAAGALFVVPYLLILKVADGQGIRVRPPEADRAEAGRLRVAWRDAVAEALRGFLRAEIGAHVARRYAMTLELAEAPGLRQVRGLGFHVPTRAEETLVAVANGMDGGSIALSGPRGVGKTDLLHAFCLDGGDRMGVVMAAPVVYERREFMLGLFARLCRQVTAAGMDAAAQAAAHLRWIEYLQTRTDEAGVSAGGGWLGLSAKRGVSHARQPLTYLEIVDALKGFLAVTATELTTKGGKPRGLVVGIDELDRIEPAARARDLLNELKVVFDVPGCLFLLSVSDEALREADLAPVGRRDVFDSAIDEIIRVEPLDLATAIRLLDTRAVGLPVPFTALFHCLSGGMPRDLLRTARAAAALPGRPASLGEVAAALVTRESARLVDDHEPLASVRRAFLGTVEEVFTAALTKDDVLKAAEPGFPGSFDILAGIRRDLGVADERAARSLDEVRRAWGLPG